MAKIDKIQLGDTVYNLGVKAENIDGKVPVDLEDYYNKEETNELLEDKQATLTAGENITIDENNVISASGGGTGTKPNFYMSNTMTMYYPIELDKLDKNVVYTVYIDNEWNDITIINTPTSEYSYNINVPDKKAGDICYLVKIADTDEKPTSSLECLMIYFQSYMENRSTNGIVMLLPDGSLNPSGFNTTGRTPLYENKDADVEGTLNFLAIPKTSIVPTEDNDIVNKKYVDDNAGGGVDTTIVPQFIVKVTENAWNSNFLDTNKNNQDVSTVISADMKTKFGEVLTRVLKDGYEKMSICLVFGNYGCMIFESSTTNFQTKPNELVLRATNLTTFSKIGKVYLRLLLSYSADNTVTCLYNSKVEYNYNNFTDIAYKKYVDDTVKNYVDSLDADGISY